MKESETLCGGTKWKRHHTKQKKDQADQRAGVHPGWENCGCQQGRKRQTSQGFWGALSVQLGIRGSHMDGSLLRLQQGGSQGAQLRSLAIAQCEMGPASEKMSGEEPHLGLGMTWGKPAPAPSFNGNVSTDAPHPVVNTWSCSARCCQREGLERSAMACRQGPSILIFRLSRGYLQAMQWHCDRHKLAAAICNALILRIGAFPFFFLFLHCFFYFYFYFPFLLLIFLVLLLFFFTFLFLSSFSFFLFFVSSFFFFFSPLPSDLLCQFHRWSFAWGWRQHTEQHQQLERGLWEGVALMQHSQQGRTRDSL